MKYYPKLESVDLGEKFDVKTAATKKGKISITSFDSLDDAKKHLAAMEKKGLKGIISKDGKPVKEEAEIDEAVKVGDNVKVKLYRKVGGESIQKGKVIKIEKDSILVKHDFSNTPSRVSMKNIVKEEVELTEDVIVMGKGRVTKSVKPDAKKIKELEKDGWRIQGVIEKGSKILKKDAKAVMKAIKGGDKLGIGEAVELEEAPKNYYEIGGDRYDAGVVFTVYVKGKKVHDQILDANDDYEYKGKKYGDVDKAMDAIAKAHGLKVKDFKRVNMEEVELDEKKETAQYTDGKQEKITVTVDNMRKVNIDTVITKNLRPGWKKVEKKSGGVGRSIYDEVDLDEATEKDILAALKKERISGYFSGGTLYVAQRALETARDLLRSMKLKSIPKLVGEHKGTKPHKHPHEDDLEESGMSDLHLHIKDGKSAKEIAKLMKVDVKTIEKLMKGFNEKVDPADVDDEASDDDIKAADKNIMMQLRKSVSLKGKFKVEFGDKKKKEVPVRIAQEVQKKYNSLRRPADKEEFQSKIAKSYEDMLKALKENAIKEKTSQDRIVGLVSDKLREKKHG